jgi:copper type II ascorbate-dependent monooxygenase-like protein
LGRAVTVAFAVGSLIAGCTSAPSATDPAAGGPPASDRSAGGQTSSAAGGSPSRSAHPHSSAPASAPIAALRPGERWITLPMPGGAYRPQAEAGGADDYRCILLDPKIAADSFLSGVVLQPGNPNLVHHAILYRVDPEQLGAAKAKDAGDPRLGWSCFGGPGLPGNGADLGGLNSAPWVAAWATSGGEQRFAAGTGQRARAGTRVILQMHYNLLNGDGADSTTVKLRLAPRGARLQPLQTLLLPAPVELPCAPKETGPLCDREASVMDVIRRFGVDSGRVVAGLQLLCDGSFTNPKAGPTQSCGRPVTQTLQLRAVAGHMHLLGRSVRIDLQRQDGTGQRLLDVKVWDFDDQRATVLPETLTVRAGDRLRVSCTHDATLRRTLPALRKLPPRYVVWGEGSSDEMCLGIVSYTKP